MKRVFVSSVIRGFEDYRQAARHAIGLVGFLPIMAEDFPAQPRSPQAACLEGVRSSDIYVGILGSLYGTAAEGGLSATEEEFDEASRLSMPRLIFVTSSAVDDQQKAFIERVQGKWGEGLFYSQFDSPNALKDAVVRALSALLTPPEGLSEGQATECLDKLLARIRNARNEVAIGLAVVPRSQGAPLINLGDIDDFASVLPGLVSDALNVKGKDWDVVAKEHSVEITRKNAEAGHIALESFDDGQLCCILELGRTTRNDLAGILMIDADRVESDMAKVLEAFSGILVNLDSHGSVTGVYLQGSLKGVRGKAFGVLPREPVTSMTIPSHGLADPLPFPTVPIALNAQDLRRAKTLARTLRATLGRMFGAAAR